jgi:outer membrane protein assembly factor BamB
MLIPRQFRIWTLTVALSVPLVTQGQTATVDWPQWRGPDRSNVSRETGLLQSWPTAGPPVVWTSSVLGKGYGAVAVAGARIFAQGSEGRQSFVYALNRQDGKTIWSKALGPTSDSDRGPGPRGTPTVDDDRVYVLTEAGNLVCLRVADGAVVWQRHILKEFGGGNPYWLLSESPLVDGASVIVTPGGQNATIAALDKMTGKTRWTTRGLSDPAGYSSAIVADVHGVRTVMALTAAAGVGVRASDGKPMFRYEKAANDTANVATPVFFDNKVFYTSNYGTGGALLELTAEAGEVKAKEVYFTRDMQNHHGGVLLVNGYLYGFSNAILTCVEFATGKTMWRHRSVGKGALTYADGRLYVLSENNVVGLATISPTGYAEMGRFKIADQGWPSWAHPVVAGGRLFIRDQNTLTAYDVRKAS